MINDNGIKMIFVNNEDKELPLIVAGFYPLFQKNIMKILMLQKLF